MAFNRCCEATDVVVKDCFSQTYLSFSTTTPTSPYLVNSVLACVVNGLFNMTGVILNSLVLMVFMKSKMLRDDLGYFLLFVLSSFDMATSCLVHPFFIVTSIAELCGTINCTITATSVLVFAALAGISLLTSLVMNLERYVAIVHPYFYERSMTRKRLLLAVCVLTVCWLVIIALPFVYLKVQSLAYVFTIIFFCCTVAVLYWKIFSIARTQRILITSQLQATMTNGNGNRSHCAARTYDLTATSKMLADLKLAKTYVTIILCYFCCYLPDAAFLLTNQFSTSFAKSLQARMIEKWVFTFVAATSTLNSIIFFWRNRQLRTPALRMIDKFWKLRR